MSKNPETSVNICKETHEGICPYYIRDKGNGVLYCECARFRFPDKIARREIVYGYCAHPEGYRHCALKQMLDHFYERKYASIQNQIEKEIDHATTTTN